MLKKVASLALLALIACSPAPQSTTTSTATSTAAAAFDPGLKPAAVYPEQGVSMFAPITNARVRSPLISTGVAPANWFFEAQFHAELIGADGKTIVEAPAMALEDWTNGNATHPYRAELAFNVAADTPATLLLREDMPPDEDRPEARQTREIRIPVTLAAH